MTIHFGTDGWRAVISDYLHLRQPAHGHAGHRRCGCLRSLGQVGGYGSASSPTRTRWWSVSTRASSPTATPQEVARVLAANGFTVLLAQADAPTPAISFAVKNQNAIAGVMITASHNAPRYNGVKLKSSYRRLGPAGAMPPGGSLYQRQRRTQRAAPT